MKKQLNKLAKSSALVIALATFCTAGYAQDKEPTDSTILLIQNPETNTVDTVYTIVDEMPEYPGGILQLSYYVEYPEELLSSAKSIEELEGVVIVQFVVNERGEIGNVSIAQSLRPEFDSAVINGVKRGVLKKKFKPGKLNGRPVKVRITMGINFRVH
ncbi:MAG: energy transducer TonB [Salinivirgaceae bacterium]|nr:energy transducer TonB [Salinivirgaceae bacterium]